MLRHIPIAILLAVFLLFFWVRGPFVSRVFAASLDVYPGESIQKAVNDARSGDSILVRGGAYNERVSVGKSSLVIQGEGSAKTKGFTIEADNVTVDGFHIADTTTCNGGIFAQGENNRIKNNKIQKVLMAGIIVSGKNSIVEHNEIWDTRQRVDPNTKLCSGEDADGIRFFGSGHVIRKNYIHDIHQKDNPTAHRDCFQTWQWGSDNPTGKDIRIEHNICMLPQVTRDLGAGMMYDPCDGCAANLTYTNNIISAHRSFNGIDLRGLNFSNNTLVGTLDPSYEGNDYAYFSGIADLVVQNNIFYNKTIPILVTDIKPKVSGYNMAYRSDGKNIVFDSYFPKQPTDIWGTNPDFINTTDPKSPDFFRPKPSSAACRGGRDGTYLGAVPCSGQAVHSTIPADGNNDQRVDNIDYVIWLSHYGRQVMDGAVSGDFNTDGRVNMFDLMVFLVHYIPN